MDRSSLPSSAETKDTAIASPAAQDTMNMNKAWMDKRLLNGFITDEFIDGVEQFVEFAKRHPECMNGDELRCPCNHCKCRNKAFRDEDTVKVHLCKKGFVPNYYNWYCHGKPYLFEQIRPSGASSSTPIAREKSTNDIAMQLKKP